MSSPVRNDVRAPQLLLGLALLGVGTVLLLGRLEIIDVSIGELASTWWPLVIVLVGLSALLTVPRAWPGPVALMALGGLFLLDRLDAFTVDLGSLLWPIALIVVGLFFLLRFGRPHSASPEVITSTAIWWGAEPSTTSQQFRSATLTAIMGGIELDLRRADIQGRADISVFAFWGGVEIKVPPTWRVTVRGLPLLGGWENNAAEPTDPNAPELVVHITTIMAGAEIKNSTKGLPAAEHYEHHEGV